MSLRKGRPPRELKTTEGAADDDNDAVSDTRRHQREGNPRFAIRDSIDETLETYQRIRNDQRGLRLTDVELASTNNRDNAVTLSGDDEPNLGPFERPYMLAYARICKVARSNRHNRLISSALTV